MKITVGKLRHLIKEAISPKNLEVGKWYVVEDEHRGPSVVQLLKIKPYDSRDPDANFLMAVTGTGADDKTSQRLEFWADRVVREATPEEIEAAKAGAEANNDWMRKNLNTGREGT